MKEVSKRAKELLVNQGLDQISDRVSRKFLVVLIESQSKRCREPSEKIDLSTHKLNKKSGFVISDKLQQKTNY